MSMVYSPNITLDHIRRLDYSNDHLENLKNYEYSAERPRTPKMTSRVGSSLNSPSRSHTRCKSGPKSDCNYFP
jgi:hypothetical protein